MINIIILLTLYILLPVFIIILTERNNLANKTGAVLIAYAIGIFIGHSGLIPSISDNFFYLFSHYDDLTYKDYQGHIQTGTITQSDLLFFRIRNIQDLLMTITIPLAIPLLLFSVNIREWFRLAGKTILSMLIALIGVSFIVTIGFFIFRGADNELCW